MFAHTPKNRRWALNAVVSRKYGLLNIYLLKSGVTPCVVCGEPVAVLKEHNVSRHYETKINHSPEAGGVRLSEDSLANFEK